MKVAFTAKGKDLDAPMDTRFGRASNFLVVETDSGELTVVDNTTNLNAAQGAGIQAAQSVIESGACCLICDFVGPKAHRVLSEGDVKMYSTKAATVGEALILFLNNELEETTTANAREHWT